MPYLRFRRSIMNNHNTYVNIRQTFAVLMLALLLLNTQTTVAQAQVIEAPMCEEQPAPALIVPKSFKFPSAQTEVAMSVEPSVQDVLLNVCEIRGYGKDCAKTLLGMLWTESSNQSTVIGDNGKARGYFQIHYKMHNISSDCAEDLICSANWTLDYLESNNYPTYVNYAVQCHNGCNANNGYVSKVIRYGNSFWETPLTVNQAAPIELAIIPQEPDQVIQ